VAARLGGVPRTTGDGADPMLLNAGQPGRRGRNWWRLLLDLYGAADVIMPIARLERSWPGGPVTGHFSARYGPDNQYIGSFTLRVARSADIPKMMTEAVRKIDGLYSEALVSGVLRPDPSLVIEEPINAVELTNVSELDALMAVLPSEGGSTAGATSVSIQFETPGAASVAEAEGLMRLIPGVRGASTTSLALGGMSVMQVSFEGPVEQLRAALETRGFNVTGSGTNLRIMRRTAAPPPAGGGGQ
jgi:hypothetical protein